MLLIILLFTLYLAINNPLAFNRLLRLSIAVINTLIAIASKLYSLYTASNKGRR